MRNYSNVDLQALEVIHSSERMQTYRSASAGDLGSAFELYLWNTILASRFYGALEAVEVAIRNACHRELSSYFGLVWYRTNAFWSVSSPYFRDVYRAARRRILRAGNVETPGRIVAEYTLGFWTTLFNTRYAPALWPALGNAFPHGPASSRAIAGELGQVLELRNRIAHLEPLLARNLDDDVARLERVSSWVSPTLEHWIQEHEVVREVLVCRALLAATPTPWSMGTF